MRSSQPNVIVCMTKGRMIVSSCGLWDLFATLSAFHNSSSSTLSSNMNSASSTAVLGIGPSSRNVKNEGECTWWVIVVPGGIQTNSCPCLPGCTNSIDPYTSGRWGLGAGESHLELSAPRFVLPAGSGSSWSKAGGNETMSLDQVRQQD